MVRRTELKSEMVVYMFRPVYMLIFGTPLNTYHVYTVEIRCCLRRCTYSYSYSTKLNLYVWNIIITELLWRYSE